MIPADRAQQRQKRRGYDLAFSVFTEPSSTSTGLYNLVGYQDTYLKASPLEEPILSASVHEVPLL